MSNIKRSRKKVKKVDPEVLIDMIIPMLVKLNGAVRIVSRTGFEIKDSYPKKYPGLREYLLNLGKSHYNKAFCFVGCLLYPVDYTGGHNHFVIIDNGLITNYSRNWEHRDSYEDMRALVFKQLFSFERSDYLIPHADVHVLSKYQLNQYSVKAVKEAVRDLHPSFPSNLPCRLVVAPYLTGGLITVSSEKLGTILSR